MTGEPESEERSQRIDDASQVKEGYETTLPAFVREQLQLDIGDRLQWMVVGDSVVLKKLPDDPVRALRGILKGSGYTFQDFMRERNEERQREFTQEEEEEEEEEEEQRRRAQSTNE